MGFGSRVDARPAASAPQQRQVAASRSEAISAARQVERRNAAEERARRLLRRRDAADQRALYRFMACLFPTIADVDEP